MEAEVTKHAAPRLSLIDFSAEDDSLFIASPFCDFKNSQTTALSETCNELNCLRTVEAESAQGLETAVEKVPIFSEPSDEPTRARKVGKCNLRKSLAWDSAFFTSEGVLDPDELAIVTKPLKAAAQILPGIEEDIRRSTESSSTLGSDNWALENLEVDLFEDIRASIQKSGHGCDKASNVASSISKAAQREPDTSQLSSSQKVQLTSRNQMKPVSKLPCTSKRQSISKVEAEKTVEPLACSRTGVSRKVDRNLSLKPPKILSGANPLPNVAIKRTVAASDCAKAKNNTSQVSGNVVNRRPAVSKKQISGDSRGVPSSTLPSAISSLSSTCTTKMRPTVSGSSVTSSDSTSSTGKSATKHLRNKTLPKNAEQSSVGSIRTPLCNSINKIRSRNAHLSSYVMSTSKLSSSISSASSLDGMSSESSSSICSASQRPKSSKSSFDVISLDSLESEAPESPDSQKHTHDQLYVGNEDSGKELLNQDVDKASTKTCPPPHPTAAAAPKSLFAGNAGLHFKPSGLRMPSPKIGFFDAEKSAGVTLNGCLQSQFGMQIGLLKNASANGNFDGSLKQKSRKFQPTRSLAQTGLMKFNSNIIGSPQYASTSSSKHTSTPHHQLPIPIAELSGNSAATDGDPNMFVKERHGQSSSKQQESNEKKILVSEDHLDGLSRNLENVNLSMETTKDLKGVKGFSLCPGVQSSDCSSDLSSSSLSEEFVQDRKVSFVQSMKKPIVSTSPISMELQLNARSPLAVNCSFGNTSISLEPTSKPTAEKTTDKICPSPFLDKVMQTPSVPLLDYADEIGQENVIVNGFQRKWLIGNEKENNSE